MVLPLLLRPAAERRVFLLELSGRDWWKAQWPGIGAALWAIQAIALHFAKRKLRLASRTLSTIFEEPIISSKKSYWLLSWPFWRRSLWIRQGPLSHFTHPIPQPLNSNLLPIFRSLKSMTLRLRKSSPTICPETSSTKPGYTNTIKNHLK